jgi:hypothetical protein
LSSLLLLLKANSGTESSEQSGYPPGQYKSPRKSMYVTDDRLAQEGDSMSLSNSLTIEDLRGYFHLPIVEVAKQLGTCTTALKKICRKHKIRKWPYRQIRSLTKSIQSLEMASLNDTMGDDVRDQYREQIVTLQKAIDDIVFDPNTNISALAKKLEAEWGAGEDDRMLDSEPSDNVRQIIQAAAATVGVEGSGSAKAAQAKRKHSQMETITEGTNGGHSQSGYHQSSQDQHSSSSGQHSSAVANSMYTPVPRPTVPKKVPETVSIGLTQVSQVALSVSDTKNTSIHFIGPVILAPLERRRISKLTSKKLVPLIEPDICNHFKMEFLPQGPLLQVRFCQPPDMYHHAYNQGGSHNGDGQYAHQGGEPTGHDDIGRNESMSHEHVQQQPQEHHYQSHEGARTGGEESRVSQGAGPDAVSAMPSEGGGEMEEVPQDDRPASAPTGAPWGHD